MSKYFPDRKVLAGGIASVVAWVLVALAVQYGLPITPEMQATITMAVSAGISYLVPPSQRDIIKRLNDQLVAIAQNDPAVPVSKPPSK